MAVDFEELEGSPSESFTSSEGFTATRRLRCAWADRYDFIDELTGYSESTNARDALKYPGVFACYTTGVKVEPEPPDKPDKKSVTLNSLSSYQYAIVTVEFAQRSITLSGAAPPEPPEPPTGTFFTYRQTFGGEIVTIPGRVYHWEDNQGVVPDDINFGVRRGESEHHLQWHRVPKPPWRALQQMRGRVNSVAFLGAPIGHLLFPGAEVSREFDRDPEATPLWTIGMTFIERNISYNGVEYGWQHVFRENPAGFVRLLDGNNRPAYEEGDFNTLFQFQFE